MGNDFFDHFSCAICSIGVAASHKSSDVSLQFITESKLDVVTGVARLFGIVSFGSTFLVTFHVDHTAVNINGDGFELAPPQQLSEDFEIDFSAAFGLFCS